MHRWWEMGDEIDPWLSLIWRCLLKTQILECENLKHNCLRSSGNVEEICVRVGMLGSLVFFFLSREAILLVF